MGALRKQKRKIISAHMLKEQVNYPVLIVEDSQTLAEMLASMIRNKWACDVHIAVSYAEAKSYLNQYRYDYHIAVCDLHLPDAPQAEIIDLMNKAKVQFIAISGSYGNEKIEEILNRGAVDFIDKNNINAYQYVTELVGRLYKNHQVKVLVVDDSKSASQVITSMLEVQNYVVLRADNGLQALEVLQNNPDIKVILTDYNMPKMDGIELAVKVRQNHSKEHLSIIALSGSDHQDLSSNFIKNGANDFLLKPYSYNELLCRVNQNVDMLEYMEHIRNLANRDYLTQAFNRRYFFSAGKKIYQTAKQNNQALTVCMLDIDHFKQVNDQYGHDCGDIVLVRFVEIINQHFEPYLSARLGGEEFAVMFHNIDFSEVLEKLEQFRLDIQNTVISCEHSDLSITVSMGASQQFVNDLDGMLKIADDHLYQAKKNGRNQVVA